MDTSETSDRYVSGGPTEAGFVVIQVLAGIAAPLIAIGAVAARSWQLLAMAALAAVVFSACSLAARYAAHELTIRNDTVTFKRAAGPEQSYAKREVYVEKRLSNYGPDALFCVKHSFVTYRFPLEFTSHARSGQLLTLEKLAAAGIEIR